MTIPTPPIKAAISAAYPNPDNATARTGFAALWESLFGTGGMIQMDNYITSVAGTNTITGSVSPTPTAYVTGAKYRFIVANTNTGAVTLNINSVGAVAATYQDGTAFTAGSLVAGKPYEFVYDGTAFRMVAPAYAQGTFTPTVEGTSIAGSGTYSQRLGYYARIGNLVFIDILLTWSAHTGTGNMIITGLPFSCTQNASLSIFPGNLAMQAAKILVCQAGGTSITFNLLDQATGAPAVFPIDTAAGQVTISGCYIAA